LTNQFYSAKGYIERRFPVEDMKKYLIIAVVVVVVMAIVNRVPQLKAITG